LDALDWAKNVFLKHADLYQMVLEGMWERGEEDAVAISSYLAAEGLAKCKILDAPCGIGRVAIPLARLGFDVTGVDFSPALVSTAKRKATEHGVGARNAQFLVGDLRDLASKFEPASFDVVLNVFTSIGYGSEEDDLRFFRDARTATKPGGLILIAGLRNRDYVARNPTQNIYEESSRLLVLDTYNFDPSRSRERGVWRFYLKGREKAVLKFAGEFPIDIRIYSPHELVSRLEATGWKVKETYDSFVSKRPCRNDSPVYAVVARAD